MSFNIGHALLSAAETFVTTGNPVAAGVSGIVGGCEGSPSGPSALESSGALQAQPDALLNTNRLSQALEDFSYIGGDN